MTAAEFKAIRQARGESEIQFARALGYEGSDRTVHRLMRRIERGEKEITPTVALRAMELLRNQHLQTLNRKEFLR